MLSCCVRPSSEPPSNDDNATDRVRFLILSGPRTGSTMLVSALNSGRIEEKLNIPGDTVTAETVILRMDNLSKGTEGEKVESPITIDLAGSIDDAQGAAKVQVSYMVDMAKADALDVLGDARQALELVDRHV